ncbi:MAG: response regulator [Pseudomonadota bacterium]
MKRKILIVEDDKDTARLLDVIVKSAGFESKIVNDGEEALDIIEEYHPDLVLLDLMMPKVHGFAVCKQIRDNRNYDDIKILIVSAKSFTADMKKAEELGANGYLTKPFRKAELIDEMNKLLGA